MIPLWVLVAAAQEYAFPTTAEDYGNFYPTAYYDQGGTTDWACGDITYSGHRGSDFGVGSWTGMDEGRDVAAAATGVVSATNDGVYDRCSTGTCEGGGGCGNYVEIAHANGFHTLYCHMKQWSVAVAVGDTVACGQMLGEVGSSGYSTGPHLHFQVEDSSGFVTDPFEGDCAAPPSYWVDQGSHGGLPVLVCEDVPACTAVDRLSCGENWTGRNDGSGATTSHGVYGCTEWAYSGAEVAFDLVTSLDETVTVRMTGLSADLDVYVLQDAACDGTGCLASSDNPDASDESVAYSASAGVVYTLVVDGFDGAASDFSLSVSCAGSDPAEVDHGEEGGGGGETAAPDSASPGADSGGDPQDEPGGFSGDNSEGEGVGTRISNKEPGGCAALALWPGLLLLGRRRRQ